MNHKQTRRGHVTPANPVSWCYQTRPYDARTSTYTFMFSEKDTLFFPFFPPFQREERGGASRCRRRSSNPIAVLELDKGTTARFTGPSRIHYYKEEKSGRDVVVHA
jgi:hypothetical protein